MKKLIVATISGIIVMSAGVSMSSNFIQAASEEYVEEGYYVEVSASDGGVNMRQGPGVEYEIVREMIPNGEILYIEFEGIATNGNSWGYTEYEGIEGWVSLNMVQEIEYEEEESVSEEKTYDDDVTIKDILIMRRDWLLKAIEECNVDEKYLQGLEIEKIADFDIAYDTPNYQMKFTDNVFEEPFLELTSKLDTDTGYIGELKNNKPEGSGILVKSMYGMILDIVYIGDFKDGRLHGAGIKFDSDTGEIQIMNCENGKARGLLFKIFPSLSGYTLYIGKEVGDKRFECKIYEGGTLVYDGEMEDGEYDGFGIEYSFYGNKIYEGEFKDGYRDGQGTEYDEEGNVIYSGKWKDGDYTAE